MLRNPRDRPTRSSLHRGTNGTIRDPMCALALARRLGCLSAVALGCAAAAGAQESVAVLRGSVFTANGDRIPYALLRLSPSLSQRFTDERGQFVLAPVAPGTYRLEVRQVGFQPFDTSITVGASGVTLRVALQPVAIQLTAVTVTTERRCTNPGPPDAARDPTLASIFAQVRENAERFAVLADSYPFRYLIARSFTDSDERGVVTWSLRDTVEYRSNARARYRPGSVVGFGPGPGGGRARVMNLPGLPDLADSAFHANHCFAFGGVVERDGTRLVRVVFRAAESLRNPDIDGEVDLDQTSFQVRHATIRLTRASRALPGTLSVASSVGFAELYPNIVVPTQVSGTLVPVVNLRVRDRIARYDEEQRLIHVHFLRPLPSAWNIGP